MVHIQILQCTRHVACMAVVYVGGESVVVPDYFFIRHVNSPPGRSKIVFLCAQVVRVRVQRHQGGVQQQAHTPTPKAPETVALRQHAQPCKSKPVDQHLQCCGTHFGTLVSHVYLTSVPSRYQSVACAHHAEGFVFFYVTISRLCVLLERDVPLLPGRSHQTRLVQMF